VRKDGGFVGDEPSFDKVILRSEKEKYPKPRAGGTGASSVAVAARVRLFHGARNEDTVLHTVDFLFVSRDNGRQAAAEAGFTGIVGEEIGTKAGSTFHKPFFSGFRVKIRVLDHFARMVLLHHPGLV